MVEDGAQVGCDARVGGDEHREAIFGDAGEGVWRVDSALVEEGVDGVGEELCNEVRGAGESQGLGGGGGGGSGHFVGA